MCVASGSDSEGEDHEQGGAAKGKKKIKRRGMHKNAVCKLLAYNIISKAVFFFPVARYAQTHTTDHACTESLTNSAHEKLYLL